MSYEVVARRWRPATFAQVVGQPHVADTLAAAIERDRLPHAFLFTGVRGVGKTTIARLLAKSLNCTARQGAEPCNECPSCRSIVAGSSVDVIEIDAASNRGIDDIRDLIENSQYRPAGSRFKVYIIDEVHQLTKDAFNALLKTLEEPPDHVKFIMATTEAHKLLPTVLSRCQRYDFRRLSEPEITAQLTHIVGKDGLSIAADALALLAHEADGSMRDAQSLLEQVVSAGDGEINAEQAALLLGVAGHRRIGNCLRALVEREPAQVVELVTELREFGADCTKFLGDLLDVLRHVTVAAAAGVRALDSSLPEATKELAKELAPRRAPLDLQRIFSVLLVTMGDLHRDIDPFLVLEMALLKAACLHDVATASEVLARLEALGSGSGPTGGGSAGPSRGPGPGGGQRGASAPARNAAPPAPRPSVAPAGSSAAKPAAAAATPTSGSASPSASSEPSVAPAGARPSAAAGDLHIWEIFLEDVRNRLSMELYFALSSCELISQSESLLEIRPKAAGLAQSLTPAGVLLQITEVARSHFGAKVDVRLAGRSPVAPPVAAAAPAAEQPSRLSFAERAAAPLSEEDEAPEEEAIAAEPEPTPAPAPAATPVTTPQASTPAAEARPPQGDSEDPGPGGLAAPVTLKTPRPSPDTPISAQGLEDDRKKRKEAEAVADPVVQTAIRELGGEVRQIKPLND